MKKTKMISKRVPPPITKEEWDMWFEEGGNFETYAVDGRLQTRLFAEAFCKHTRLQSESVQSLFDCSCALGDALPVFLKNFPTVRLYASDLSAKAIQRCLRGQFSNLASFFVASIEDISDMYDVIYSSNTFEHFPDYRDKARTLLRHCIYLCILVPYNEKRFGKDLEYDPSYDHVVTFREHSFDFLLDEGCAKRIYHYIFTVPKAWSWSPINRIIQPLKNIVRLLLKRPIARNRKQILFEIERAD